MLFLLVEAALRVAPGLIPPPLLLDFNPRLRSRIARRLNLPTRRDVRYLSRDDGGPPEGVRIFMPRARVTYDFPDPGITPHRQMDAEGFCNPPGPDDGSGRRDLVTLGDSFTFCVGVGPDQTWTRFLASDLGVSAVNLGTPGIGPYEALQIFKRLGLPRAPRVVVLNLYEGNDLRDADRYFRYRAAHEVASARPGEGGPEPSGHRRVLGRNSYAYNLAVAMVRVARGLGGGTPSENPDRPADLEFRYRVDGPGGAVEFNPGNMDAGEPRIALRLRSGEIRLDLFREALENYRDLGRRHGFIPVLAYTPSAHTAYAGGVTFRNPELAGLMAWFSRTQRGYLAAEAVRLEIPFVDLTETMRAAAEASPRDEPLYFPSILHLTARGHRVVAGGLSGPIRALLAASGPVPRSTAGPGTGR